MPRGLTSEQIAAASSKSTRPAMFVFIDVPDAPIYAWDGVGPITTGGATWYGVGQFGIIEGISNDQTMKTENITVGLHGIPASSPVAPDIIGKSRTMKFQGRELLIKMTMMKLDSDEPLSDPWIMWRGVADVASYNIGESVSVSLSGENYASLLRRINGLRMSSESHIKRVDDPRDIIFRFLNRLAGKPRKVL